jgi:gliding motility-associated-like protein
MLPYKRYTYFFILIASYLSVFSQTQQSLIRFTENKHQWQDFILYRAQLDGGALFAEANAITYSFYDKETYRNAHANPGAKPNKEIKTTGFRVLFTNSNSAVIVESENAAKDYCNYFIGNDKNHWASNVKNYQRLLYKNLWQNVNLEMLGQDNSVKCNFYVKPGGDPSKIQLQYDKTEKIYLQKKQLIIKTPLNELVEHEPYAYQIINGKTIEVPCDFQLKKNTVSFSFPKGYNKKYELVIDPVLVFACTSGSTADNFGFCATYDPQGNLYSGGIAFYQGYPTIHPYDSIFISNPNFPAPDVDVVITKYDSTGTYLHYSTYLGGSKCETVTSLIVDAQNNLFMHGATGSADFPITSQAYDNSFGGGDSAGFTGSGTYFINGSDLYVAKLSAGGNQLLASTFIGGSKNDGLNINNSYASSGSGGEAGPDSLEYNYGDQYRGEIQLDNIGNPVISSCTRSPDFPIKNGFGSSLKGQQDAVLFKFNPNLSQLQWSTFVGGSNNESGCGLYIGKRNEIYTTGGTSSNDFPIKPGAYNSLYGGQCDGYITKVSQNGDSLLASTYIGTPSYDQSFFIQLDNAQNVYVYGQSLGSMSVTPSTIYQDTGSHQFISKFNNQLNQLIYQTVVGNKKNQINISPTAFLIDNCQNVYVSGWGGDFRIGIRIPADSMPLVSPTIQDSTDGYNFYLMQLSSNCNSLLYATYYGGNVSKEHVHGGTSRYDKRGIVYQALCTSCGGNTPATAHQDFPVYPSTAWPGTPGHPNHNTQNYNCAEATFKIDFKPQLVIASYTANKFGCAPLTVTFNNVSTGATSYLWNFGNNDTTSHVPNPVRTYTTAGTYTAMLCAYNPTTCNLSDTSIITITVYPKPTASFVPLFDSCKNSTHWQNTSSISSGTMYYNWNFGNGQTDTTRTPGTINYPIGTYTATLVTLSNKGCYDSTKQVLHFGINQVQSYPDTAFCLGKSIQLHASGGTSYSWQPNAGLNNTNIANPIATPTSNTIYTVTITQLDAAGRTCNFILTDSIKIYPKVTAAFNYSVNLCGNTLAFKDSSYTNITSWHWNFGDTLFDTHQNPTHSYSHPGTYTVSLFVNNQYNCPDSTEKVISLGGFNPISISRGVIVCSGKSVQLNATGGITYTWTPSGNLNNANIANPIATPTATTQYTLALTQISTLGDTCTSTLHTNITVPFYSSSALTVYASPDTIIDGNSSQLSTSLSGGYIVWSPDYNLSNDSILNPVASPHHTTTYTAVYIDPSGCKFPVSNITIYVLSSGCNENTVFVPNTFTPNADGANDILYARSSFVTDIHFVVADRWGQIVFETYDINKGWDGVFNGKPCNPDVFGYYITYKCNNGQQSFRKGNVTLIR